MTPAQQVRTALNTLIEELPLQLNEHLVEWALQQELGYTPDQIIEAVDRLRDFVSWYASVEQEADKEHAQQEG